MNAPAAALTELLICLSEECAEIIKAATKALRFGTGASWPKGSETNAMRISRELGDVLALIDRLVANPASEVTWDAIEIARAAKSAKLRRWLTYDEMHEPEISSTTDATEVDRHPPETNAAVGTAPINAPTMNGQQRDAARHQGWAIFECDDGRPYIQRIDDPTAWAEWRPGDATEPRFECDADAISFVQARAAQGDPIALFALRIAQKGHYHE